MTILERAILAERPCFFVTAGQRGSGKTTLLSIISLASTGHRATAAAWSTGEEERRKAILAYLAQGVDFLVWDNIKRAAIIDCPHIERACTALEYSDRILGFSEFKAVPATTIMGFTGNNIGSSGDVTSQKLEIRIEVDRPDPENRQFYHPDPIGWTLAHRGRILRALYTIMLGNPLLDTKPDHLDTRFKDWWHLIGSAVEHAARLMAEEEHAFVADADPSCPTLPIRFKDMVEKDETEDEQGISTADVLNFVMKRWPNGFQASDLSRFLADDGPTSLALKDALESAAGTAIKIISSKTVSRRLKAICNKVVMIGNLSYCLRFWPDQSGEHAGTFRVDQAQKPA
jgi:hypothetical protein